MSLGNKDRGNHSNLERETQLVGLNQSHLCDLRPSNKCGLVLYAAMVLYKL
jgi:hypothetical protein